MKFKKNSYEGCSKLATIFLMVLLGKKEPVPVVLDNKPTGKGNRNNRNKYSKTYMIN